MAHPIVWGQLSPRFAAEQKESIIKRALLILASVDLLFVVLAAIGTACVNGLDAIVYQSDPAALVVEQLQAEALVISWLLAGVVALVALVAAAQHGEWGWFTAIVLVAVFTEGQRRSSMPS